MRCTEEMVKDRYSAAAQKVEEGLCCLSEDDRAGFESFMPDEILSISYGCGTPAGLAGIRGGETVLDIGSGGGIDCFQASRLVGEKGQVIGVDMTDEMLEVAKRNAPQVARNLGYNRVNTDFRRGFADSLPVDDGEADLAISNCVINLTPDKETVFGELFRVLRPGGRFCISDIVSDRPVPNYLRTDTDKWGSCLSGALEMRDYMTGLTKAGFLGVGQLKFSPWKYLDGIHFFSVTLMGHRVSEETAKTRSVTFKGPFRAVVDELGNTFSRGQKREVDGWTARVLGLPAYRGLFEGALESNAAPLERTGQKPFEPVLPEESPRLWEGHFALLGGPFLQVEDDNHTFLRGEPLEISSKTLRVLEHPNYRHFFSVLNRTQEGMGETARETEGTCC